MTNNHKQLYRMKEQGIMCGICAGFAAYFAIDVIFIRVAAVVLLIIFPPITLAVYIVLRLLLSNKTADLMCQTPYGQVNSQAEKDIYALQQQFSQLDQQLQTIEECMQKKTSHEQ